MAVRWYLRHPWAYEPVAELLAERGLAVDRRCVWRWVPAYAPEINKRCRPHLKPTNKSYGVDETYSKAKGKCYAWAGRPQKAMKIGFRGSPLSKLCLWRSGEVALTRELLIP
jgi:transposase-like protein